MASLKNEVIPAAEKKTGRKAAHLQVGERRGMEAIWQAVRALKVFTRKDLNDWIYKHKTHHINDRTVKDYLLRLTRGKFLSAKKLPRQGQPPAELRYTLINDCGSHAPRLTMAGKPSVKGRGRENIWRGMRILGEFTCAELTAVSSTEEINVPQRSVEKYVNRLLVAGYLMKTHQGHCHVSVSRYRLLPSKNTGPRPPQVQAISQIYDPNINEVVWTSPAKEVEAC